MQRYFSLELAKIHCPQSCNGHCNPRLVAESNGKRQVDWEGHGDFCSKPQRNWKQLGSR